jgi:hypothetical protein
MKYSSEMVDEICKYLRAGNNISDTCSLVGINDDTFYDWKKNKPEFSDALKKAENECKARNIAIIQKAAEKSWQAAAWWLERRYNSEFALKSVQEFTGKDGQPLQFTYKVDLAGGFLPRLDSITSTSGNGITESHEIQGAGVAQTGKEDNHSVN